MRKVAAVRKAPFPSSRQSRCLGLKPKTYPHYVRGMVDYDYLGKLSVEESIWLAAFSEEYYRGWTIKAETQINSADNLRASNATLKRIKNHEDPSVFESRQGGGLEAQSELGLVAAGKGQQAHELRGRNHTENEMIRELDRRRA